MLNDFEHLSQTTDVNVMKCVKLSSDLCESNAVQIREEKCDEDISDNTGENSVDIPVQRNCNLFSTTDTHFKCDICSRALTASILSVNTCVNVEMIKVSRVIFAINHFISNLYLLHIYEFIPKKSHSIVIFAVNRFLKNIILIHIHVFTPMKSHSSVKIVVKHFLVNIISLYIHVFTPVKSHSSVMFVVNRFRRNPI